MEVASETEFSEFAIWRVNDFALVVFVHVGSLLAENTEFVVDVVSVTGLVVLYLSASGVVDSLSVDVAEGVVTLALRATVKPK